MTVERPAHDAGSATAPTLVSPAGLVPALRLAETAGLEDLLDEVTVPCPNAAVEAACVVAGMLAGGDCIDDMDLLRHGGMTNVFGGVRAPSTLGTFLRSFTHGHVQQLDKVNARLLAGQHRLGQERGPAAGPGHHHRPRRRREGPDPGPGGLGLIRVGVRRHRDQAPGVVLGHHPDDHDLTAAIASIPADA